MHPYPVDTIRYYLTYLWLEYNKVDDCPRSATYRADTEKKSATSSCGISAQKKVRPFRPPTCAQYE